MSTLRLMRNPVLPVALISSLLVACDKQPDAVSDTPQSAPENEPAEQPVLVAPEFDYGTLDGKYASGTGDLDIQLTEGMVIFNLLVVTDQGRTGEASGEIILNDDPTNAGGIYKNDEWDCVLEFGFAAGEVSVMQQGGCGMGMGVTATGTYVSRSGANAALVEGEVGQPMSELFYSADEATYRQYCQAGMEENSGRIVCVAREKTGQDSADIVHIFEGEYAGPDGDLPPLEIAKGFTILETR